MSTSGLSIAGGQSTNPHLAQKLSAGPGRIGMAIFSIALVVGIGFAGSQLVGDLAEIHPTSALPFILLGIALLVALGFEFVNGFHDTANAVPTVIYTHSLTRRSRLSGRGSGTSLASWSRRGPWRSGSSRCSPSS